VVLARLVCFMLRILIMNRKRQERESGQAVTEYATVLALFLMTALMILVLLSAFNEYGRRILSLVGLDYP